jgi:Ser/Thr protein kinase RdoA (MazF antagonist)
VLSDLARRTNGAVHYGPVLLQPHGADRKLPPLASLARDPRWRLVSHRPEKRAVLAGEDCFAKVLRPSALVPAVQRARLATTLGIGAPEVLEVDPERSLLITRTLPGVPLTARLGAASMPRDLHRVGTVLAHLHELSADEELPASDLPTHGPEQERAVLGRWGCPAVDLPAPARTTLIHRDLHDGQILIDDEHLGVIDADLLAIGDPALDLANLLVHLELRAEQGLLEVPATARKALLSGYRPDAGVLAALPAYEEATRNRLRAVYALRDPGIPT